MYKQNYYIPLINSTVYNSNHTYTTRDEYASNCIYVCIRTIFGFIMGPHTKYGWMLASVYSQTTHMFVYDFSYILITKYKK